MRSPGVRSHCPNRRRAAGFTLIEVLIALAITGLVLAATAAVFGTGAVGHAAAADADTALALAQEQIAAVEAVRSVRTGRTAGSFAGRFDWQVSVAPYEDKDAPAEAALFATSPPGAPNAAPLRLYRIETSVAWRDGRRERQLVLSTLRLLPAPP